MATAPKPTIQQQPKDPTSAPTEAPGSEPTYKPSINSPIKLPARSPITEGARIWNGLLLRVWRWWTNGICRITLGVVMLFDVVATLGGVTCPTL